MSRQLIRHAIILGLAEIVPAIWMTDRACAMLLTIGLQESDFTHRQQLIGANQWWRSTRLIAAGYWGFEEGVVKLLLEHQNKTVGPLARSVCSAFGYPQDAKVIHQALVHNDLLAGALARILLYTVPTPLPQNADDAWEQYLWAWRPGKPRRETWGRNYETAWYLIQGDVNDAQV